MTKMGRFLAWAAVVLILLSCAAHTLLGWPGLRGELERSHLPAELMAGVAMAWFFGGLAMLLFAVLVGLELRRAAPAWALFLWVGGGYFLFGVAQLMLTGSAFPLVFVVPGALLLGAAATVRPAA